VQFFLQVQQLIFLRLQHFADRNTCPAGHHIGDVLTVHFFFNQGIVALDGVQGILSLVDASLNLFYPAVADLGHLAIIAFAFGLVGLKLEVFQFNLALLNGVDQALFVVPFGSQRVACLFEVGDFFVEHAQFGRVVFPFDGFPFNLKLHNASLYLVELFGHRVYLQP